MRLLYKLAQIERHLRLPTWMQQRLVMKLASWPFAWRCELLINHLWIPMAKVALHSHDEFSAFVILETFVW